MTKLKHLKVVQELSDLGIQWEEDKDVSIQSKIFAKTERNNVCSSLRRKTMQNDVIWSIPGHDSTMIDDKNNNIGERNVSNNKE